MTTLVIDIETAPDPRWTPPADQPDAFPPCWAHRAICIGYMLLDAEYKMLELDAFAIGRGIRQVDLFATPAERDQDADERELLLAFARRVEQLGRVAHGKGEAFTLATFNGRTFDMPVIVLRSLRHTVPLPWYFRAMGMRYRYGEEGHLDLADAISDYGAAKMTSLDVLAKSIGLPGKIGVDGSAVAGLYARGDLSAIVNYCLCDVAQTALLMLRWKAVQFELPPQSYIAAEGALRLALMNDPRLADLFGAMGHAAGSEVA